MFSPVAHATEPTVDVYITDHGVQPTQVYVAVGEKVVWHNNTGQPIRVSDQPLAGEEPYRLFVPGVMTTGNSDAAVNTALDTGPSWVRDAIPPGGTFTRGYTTAGDFKFYASSPAGVTGAVTVLADSAVDNQLIDAEQGGTILVDNATLEIPPGALSEDTVISLVLHEARSLESDGIEYVQMEPDGLTFAAPVTLTPIQSSSNTQYD